MEFNANLNKSVEFEIQELTDLEFEQISGGTVNCSSDYSSFPQMDTSWISDLADKFKSFPGASTTPDNIYGDEYEYVGL